MPPGLLIRLIGFWLVILSPPASVFAGFTDVTAESGLISPFHSRGIAWGDYNGDGCIDLYVTRYGMNVSNSLYRNNCDGRFTDVAFWAGVINPLGANGAAWGDYDADGDLDLYVGTHLEEPNILYRNNGDGTFTDVTASANVGDLHSASGVAWGDYDADGDLDLFLSNGHSDFQDNSDVLYQNDGNGKFVDVAPSAGVAGSLTQVSWSSTWFDYDNNGTMDLYVSVSAGSDALYRNNGDGTFSDISTAAGISNPMSGHGVAVGDYNGDGCLDILSTNDSVQNGLTVLYRNNCNGTFTNVSLAAGILDRGTSDWGVNFVDYDNDAYLDLAIASGGRAFDAEGILNIVGPNALYKNNGNGTFIDVITTVGAANNSHTLGSAWADFDNDGDLDWYIANNADRDVLFRNDGPVGNHLKVVLQSDTGDTHGIGARVELTSNGKTQVRIIQSGQSLFSAEELAAFFGLGSASTVDKVQVLWPSGKTSVITNLAANQTIVIRESCDLTLPDGVPPSVPTGLTESVMGAGQIALDWQSSSDNVCVLGYRLYRDGIQIAGLSSTTYITAYRDSRIVPETQYCYTVTAVDAAGNESNPTSQVCSLTETDTTPPFAPVNLHLTIAGENEVDLAWGIPYDDVGVVGYKVYRDGIQAAPTTSPLYQDRGLVSGTIYCYTIIALDLSGHESIESKQSCALAGVAMLPEAPAGLTVVEVGSFFVDLVWEAPLNDVKITGYRIYQGGAPLGDLDRQQTAFSDSTVLPMTTYGYTVTTLIAGDVESLPSEEVVVTTLEQPEVGSGRNEGLLGSRCFIATAAFGSPLEPHVKLLQELRDRVFLPFRIGRAFVALYERYSPPVAEMIVQNEEGRRVARFLLWPLVGLTWVYLKTSIGMKLTAITILVFIWTAWRLRVRRAGFL